MKNEALAARHMESLRNEASRELYERLCAACEMREGGLAAADQDMIFDACVAEDIKNDLRADIVRRGIVYTVRNGRQEFKKENGSVSQLRAYCETQRKLFSELRVTPAKRGAEETAGDDFDTL